MAQGHVLYKWTVIIKHTFLFHQIYIMDIRGLSCIRLTLVLLVFELCLLTPIVSSQIQGCSMEGMDLLQCLNQDNGSFTENCCKTLRLVVRAGYTCLCSLLSPSIIPLLRIPFSLPLSNCHISVPPFTLCQVLAPMPVKFPSPKELIPPPPSAPPEYVVQPPPPHLSRPPPIPSSPPHPTRKENSTMVATHSRSNPNAVPELGMNNNGNNNNNQSSNGKEETEILSSKTLLLLLALQGFVLFA